jgi:hypothetical protein
MMLALVMRVINLGKPGGKARVGAAGLDLVAGFDEAFELGIAPGEDRLQLDALGCGQALKQYGQARWRGGGRDRGGFPALVISLCEGVGLRPPGGQVGHGLAGAGVER